MNAKPLARILLVEDDLALASAYKVRMEAENFQVLNQRISLTPLRKLWLAWKVQALGRLA